MKSYVDKARSFGCEFVTCMNPRTNKLACYWKLGGRNSSDHYNLYFRSESLAAKHFLTESREGMRAQLMRADVAFQACAELIYGDGTAASDQRAIDLARLALGIQEINKGP